MIDSTISVEKTKNVLAGKLKTADRWNETVFMAAISCFCFALYAARVCLSGKLSFYFLNWNLFLAFIPWAVTTGLIIHPRLHSKKTVVGITVCLWLLFFPNAPYILTDLFHLRPRAGVPVWFDLVMILSFAWAGLLFGFLSLWNIERVLAAFMRPRHITLLSVLLLFISSFGIYLGRFLRWNSWDILHNPVPLATDISHRILYPLSHSRTWGMTLFMGLFLTLLYFSFRLINRRR